MQRVLVTGASGFVGRSLCAALLESGYLVRTALRDATSMSPPGTHPVIVGNVAGDTNWQIALEGADYIIHLAARVHVLGSNAGDDNNLYLETNSRGTDALARAAARAGVRRFIFLSSVKVNGEQTQGRRFTAIDEPAPQDAYGRSKWLGEQAVLAVARSSQMGAVVVRPPLVYGPGVRANFLTLLRWVDRGWPLPFGAIENARSLVSIWNLTDLLVRALQHPEAVGRTWMVSDDLDLSTPDLIRMIGRAMERRVALIPVPAAVLRAAGMLTGRMTAVEKLTSSLVVDITQTRGLLDWNPPFSVEESIARTVRSYRESRGT